MKPTKTHTIGSEGSSQVVGVSRMRIAVGFLAAYVAAQIVGIVVGLLTMDQTRRAMGKLLRDDPSVASFSLFFLATAILAFLLTYIQVRRPTESYREAALMGFVAAFAVWFPDRLIFAAAFAYPIEVHLDLFWTGALRTLMGVAGAVALRYIWTFRMNPYTASVVIDRPVAETFRFVGTDYLENHPRWAPLVVSLHLDPPGVMTVGARGQVMRRQRGKVVPFAFEVTHFEVNQRIAIQAEGGPDRFTASYTMTPVGVGQTRLDIEFSLWMRGLFELIQPFMTGVFRSEVARVGRSIKEMVEV